MIAQRAMAIYTNPRASLGSHGFLFVWTSHNMQASVCTESPLGGVASCMATSTRPMTSPAWPGFPARGRVMVGSQWRVVAFQEQVRPPVHGATGSFPASKHSHLPAVGRWFWGYRIDLRSATSPVLFTYSLKLRGRHMMSPKYRPRRRASLAQDSDEELEGTRKRTRHSARRCGATGLLVDESMARQIRRRRDWSSRRTYVEQLYRYEEHT